MAYRYCVYNLQFSVFEGDLACICADIALYVAILVENKMRFLVSIDACCGFS